MIRRLHLEEVQPPVPTVAAASESNKSGDDDERQALALEFKQLLSKVVGQVDALSDEGTALAMALAQTLPAQRISPQELRKAEGVDTTQENSDHDLLDEGGADREEMTVASGGTDSESSSDQGTQSVGRETDGADKDAGSSLGLGRGDITKELIQSSDRSATTTISAAAINTLQGEQLTELNVDGAIQHAQSEVASQEMSAVTTATDGSEGEVVAQVDALAGQGDAVRVKVQDNASDEGSADFGDEAVPSQTNLAGVGEREVTRKAVSSEKQPENGQFTHNSGQQSPTSVGEQAQTVASKSEGLSSANSTERTSSDFVTRKRVENGGQEARSSKEPPTNEPEIISPSVSQATRRGSEGIVQMTILRQAFESLRAARQESAEGQVKPGAPTVTGAAATTPKRSEDTSSSKGSRHMSKGHLARMLERVQSTLTEAAKARDGKTISLRLDPANLGRVKVDVSLKEGALHARITPENQQVMTALREHAHELQGALRKLGLDVDSVTVTVRSDGFQEEAASGQNSFDGSTFQQERNNMPQERPQVVENTVGNELAQWKEAVAPEQGVGVVDHWVA